MNDPDLSDDDREQYQDEWNDLTERDLLEGIFIELTQIRALLSEGESGASRESVVYECELCGATVKDGERVEHAVNQHKAPEEVAEEFFTEQ